MVKTFASHVVQWNKHLASAADSKLNTQRKFLTSKRELVLLELEHQRTRTHTQSPVFPNRGWGQINYFNGSLLDVRGFFSSIEKIKIEINVQVNLAYKQHMEPFTSDDDKYE